MFNKKSKMLVKPRNHPKTTLNLRETMRPGPHCAACKKDFSNSSLFEEHLNTQEHKIMDSPLEYILQRVGESDNPGRPREYENLRLQVAPSETGQHNRNHGIDVSGLAIGNECISSVQVLFCQTCNTFVPEDGHPDVLRRHMLTDEHLRIASAS